jgi:PhzF family phenazine biosynthesis protein
MEIPIYQVDAFAGHVFAGNPAAICPLDAWLDEATMQSIAAENNLAETAFFVRRGDRYDLRWFTPTFEIDLCGHATLASAFVIMNYLTPSATEARFDTRSGELIVRRQGDLYALDFPARPPERCQPHPRLVEALGAPPLEIYAARDYMAVYASEEEVRALRPDMGILKALDRFAVIVTAPGREVDFVSRFFAPAAGVPEDPVTGSAHCTLIPYWSRRLDKTRLEARQVSPRGGELHCEDRCERVTIAGRAALFLTGTIRLQVADSA